MEPNITGLEPVDMDVCFRWGWRPRATIQLPPAAGLHIDWFGLVWFEPRAEEMDDMSSWLSKLADHRAGGFALVPKLPETRWFHDYVYGAATAALYGKSTGKRALIPGVNSALVAYGKIAADRMALLQASRKLQGYLTPDFSLRKHWSPKGPKKGP